MIGLIALAVLIAFVAFLIWVSGLLTRRMQPGNWKTLLRVAIVIGVFPLMVVDEIIGKYQFEALCLKENGIESVDVSKARGKRVKFEVGEPRLLKWKMVPMDERDWLYKDADTSEILIHLKKYGADGGWLVKYNPMCWGCSGPMLYNRTCDSDYLEKKKIFLLNDITQIN